MFESPIDFTDIKASLSGAFTDVGHTAAGFATLALKRGNDARLDLSKKYETQIDEFRTQLLDFVQRADETATELEDRFEPLMTKLAKQLPAPADRLAATAAEQGKEVRRRANKLVVDALRATEPAPKSAKSPTSKPDVSTDKPAVTKTAAKKTATKKTATKSAAAKTIVPKVAAKKATPNVAAKKVTKKSVAAKSTTRTATARKTSK